MNFLFYTEKLIKVFIENMVIVGIIYDINRTKLLALLWFIGKLTFLLERPDILL